MHKKINKKIKILRIITRMNVGGPAVQIVGITNKLNNELFEQKLVTGYCGRNELDYLEATNNNLIREQINGLGNSLNLFHSIFSLIRIIKVINQFKPDIVHTHTSKAGILGRTAVLLSCKRIILIHTYHGHLLYGYFNKLPTKIVILIERFLANFTKILVCVGENVKNDLIKAGIGHEKKYVVIPPGLNRPKPLPRKEALTNLNLNPLSTYCLFLGRVTKIKRPDRLIEVSKILKTRSVNVTFLIAGDGELMKQTKEKATTFDLPIVFLGWQKNIDLVLGAADILIQTSDNEGTSISVIQAQLAGIPVVATDVGSTREVIANSISGFLTSLNTYEIADKIQLLVENKDLRFQMRQSPIELSKHKYSTIRLVNDHENLYLKSTLRRASF